MSDIRPVVNTPIPLPDRPPEGGIESFVGGLPVHIRIAAMHAVLSLALVAVAVVLLRSAAMQTEQQALEAQVQAVASTVAATMDPAALSSSHPRHGDLLRALTTVARSMPVVDGVAVLERQPTGFSVVAGTPRSAVASVGESPVVAYVDGAPSVMAPIVDVSGQVVGAVVVDASPSAVQAARARVNSIAGGLALLASGLVGVFSWMVARWMSPAAVRSPTPPLPPDPVLSDLSIIGKRWDVLVKGLMEREFVRETFGRYVSERVASALVEGHDGLLAPGESRGVVLVALDVAGARDRLRKLDPVAALRWLNEVLVEMSGVVESCGGTVVELQGDGLFAVFGAPAPSATMTGDAVRAAQAMSQRYQSLARQWERSGGPAAGVRVRIALHAGPAFVGHVGSARRMRYTVVGDSVSELFGLLQVAKDADVERVCSDRVREAFDVPDRRAVGERSLASGSAPVMVWAW